MKSKMHILGVIGVFALIAALTAASVMLMRSGRPPRPVPATAPRKVIVVVVDTLRADHLGCYGYPRETSPFLDRLAAGSLLFENAYTAMSTTVPAHSSLFTSLFPLQHKVQKNGHKLSAEFLTLAEYMRQSGYMTAAFVATCRQFAAAGLDQGFVVFNEPSPGPTAYRPADRTVDQVLAWLGQRPPAERLLLWVHLFDPHRPLAPPEEHVAALRNAAQWPEKRIVKHLLDEHHITPDYYRTNGEMYERITKYDAEVRFADEQIRRLHEFVQAQPYGQETLWVIAADHGEGLGNHDWYEHGKHIYNEQLHVPLILNFPGGEHAGTRIAQQVGLIDIFPTLAELMAGDIEQIVPVQGTSLLALTAPSPPPWRPYEFAQRRVYEEAPHWAVPSKRMNYEAGHKFALQDGTWKGIFWTEGADELYNIADDPYETNDLADSEPDTKQRLRDRFRAFIETVEQSIPDIEGESVDAVSVEKLRSLGYVR